MTRPSREKVQQLRKAGYTLKTIGAKFFDPPVSKERVRQIAGNIKRDKPSRRGEHKSKLTHHIPRLDARKAIANTIEKMKFWGAAS